MGREQHDADDDDAPDADSVGDRIEEVGHANGGVAFEIVDMVAWFGADYLLGYEVIDGEFGDELQAHRHQGAGKGFERVRDRDLVEQLLERCHAAEVDPDDEPVEPPAPLTYAVVDTVAVDGATWTMGRRLGTDDPPDLFRWDGTTFVLAGDVDLALRTRVEDEIRGFEPDEPTFETIDFDLRRIVEHDGETYALGVAYDEDADEPATRVWRHLGEGRGFELIDAASRVHREVTSRFPGLFDDEDAG